ncbi:MAG: hypothetical protein ACI865_002419 [Flavobacteriaceae bacterium]|jgi:hypothetical protein
MCSRLRIWTTCGNMKTRIIYILFLIIITPLCFEGAIRVMGYKAFQNTDYTITSDPNNCIASSENLGFALATGKFKVTINDGHTYTATHENGERITTDEILSDSLPLLFMMGCSYTYGMGVNDDQNFVYLIQKELSNFKVRNFGVPGFGTVQSYLQLSKEIANGRIPEVVAVNYCDFHADRNTLAPLYRKNLSIGFQNSSKAAKASMQSAKIPYFQDGSVVYEKWTDLYHNWSGRSTFASINYLQSNADKSARAKLDPEATTLEIFVKIKKLCQKHGIRLIVTNLIKSSASEKSMKSLKENKIDCFDISLNLSGEKYTNLPFDSHPNAKAHKHYSQEILTRILHP